MAVMKRKKIVLTGGPCGGKTTMTRMLAKAFENDLVVVPESASLLFSGGFPRWQDDDAKRSLQRAVYHVQCNLEQSFACHYKDMNMILDRGTVDGAAYWPDGSEDYFKKLGTSLEKELSRYDLVIYLESAGQEAYEANRKRNPNRTETWEEARLLDEVTRKLWSQHPKMLVVENSRSFSDKIVKALGLVAFELSGESEKSDT